MSDAQKLLNNLEKKINEYKTKNDVPEHVKNYGKYNFTYKSTGENKLRAWF